MPVMVAVMIKIDDGTDVRDEYDNDDDYDVL